MDLKSYYDDLPRGQRYRLAGVLGMPAAYFHQIATGYVKTPPGHALAIEIATNGEVTRKELLPDSWQKYWLPEELDYTARNRQGVEQ